MDAERVASWKRERDSLIEELGDPAVVSDRVKLEQASRRHKELDDLIGAAERLVMAESDVATARDMLSDVAPAERDLLRDELALSEKEVLRLESELRGLLVPRDPNDGRNVIIEIRGAEGGEEANLFARDLYDMYQHYADRRGWRVELL